MDHDPSQIREEIEQTRAELAATVQALGEKADVKGRVKESAAGTVERVQGRIRNAPPDSAKQKLSSVIQKAAERPLPLWVGVAFLIGLMLGRGLGKGA